MQKQWNIINLTCKNQRNGKLPHIYEEKLTQKQFFVVVSQIANYLGACWNLEDANENSKVQHLKLYEKNITMPSFSGQHSRNDGTWGSVIETILYCEWQKLI